MVGVAAVIMKAVQLSNYMTKVYEGTKQVKAKTGQRSVSCQSMVTYKRTLETPGFQPLGESQHGSFEIIWH